MSVNIVPQLEGKVCSFHNKRGSRTAYRVSQICELCASSSALCEPLWFHWMKKHPRIQCQLCVEKHKKCSFSSQEFGITKWPTLTTSDAGKTRRAQASMKKNGTLRVPTPAVNLSVRALSEGSLPKVPCNVATSAALSTVSSDPLFRVGSQDGQSETFLLEDLVQFQKALDFPSRSSTSLSLATAGLQAAKIREAGMLESFKARIEDRQGIMDNLISRLGLELGILSLAERNEDTMRRVRLAGLAAGEGEDDQMDVLSNSND